MALRGWRIFAENHWRTFGENEWRSVGENIWRTLGENAWRIIARKLTTVTDFAKGALVRGVQPTFMKEFELLVDCQSCFDM